jgi:hypothetical protein
MAVRLIVVPRMPPGGEAVVAGDVTMDPKADLLEVVDALRTPGRLACGLNGGEQKSDQDRDDGDDDQELDQGETCPYHRIVPRAGGWRSQRHGE